MVKKGDIILGQYGAFMVVDAGAAWIQNRKYVHEVTVIDKAGKRGKIIAPASVTGIELASDDVKETLEEHFAGIMAYNKEGERLAFDYV